MVLNINKTIRANFYYCILVCITFYFIFIDKFIYQDYWECKLLAACGDLDYLKSSIREGLPIKFSDLSSTGTTWKDILFLELYTSFFAKPIFYVCLFFSFLFYIVIPCICVLFRVANPWKRFFIIDLIFNAIYIYLFIYRPITNHPLYGLIPYWIISSLGLILLLVFRYRQYKEYWL